MRLAAFRRLVDAHGADARRWPERRRADALRLLARSEAARAAWAEARRLDQALDRAAPAIDGARAAQLLGAMLERSRLAAPPRRPVRAAPIFAWSWRDALVLGMVALLGFFVGATGLVGRPAPATSASVDAFGADLVPWTRIGL